MKTLYLECNSGISGDMTVAALLDLGADREKLEEIISDMGLGCTLKFGRVEKCGISAYNFEVILPEGGVHTNRALSDIMPIIESSKLPEEAKKKAGKMFKTAREAEFREVGAVDSIADICAVAFCLCDLGIEKVIVSPLSERTGVPETMNILKVGYGVGKKDFECADVLQAFLISDAENPLRDRITVLETNIDDSTPEELGFCVEQLFKAGVKDAFFTPIYMKKCRPAYSLTVMCKPEVEDEAVRIIFTHTSSVGMRRTVSERIIMDREKTELDTEFGKVRANKFSYGDFSKISVEYESAKELAEENGVSIGKIYKPYM